MTEQTNSTPPTIEALTIEFIQDGDSISAGMQELQVIIDDAGGGPFMALHTERWAIDTPADLDPILKEAKMLMEQAWKFNNRRDKAHKEKAND